MDETYDIGLGNCDTRTRADAAADYISFWDGQARRLAWFEPWDRTLEWTPPFARWFAGGRLNASYNTLDVHLESRAEKPAILWEGEDGSSRTVTYGELCRQVKKLACVIKSMGVKKGDRVMIYLPMVPELPVSMLACARIGAVHTVVFSGFSADSLRERMDDSEPGLVITADGGYRRGAVIELKGTVDKAVAGRDFVKNVLVLERTGAPIEMTPRDSMWSKEMRDAKDECPAESLPSSHPLYILYTSGTTGKPKGVLHGTGGYLTHVNSTFKWAFDIMDSDVFFCTADIGWVTGHSYVVYGPLLHGATQVMYEGSPDYPEASRMWEIIQKYKVSIFYTTPTALRMLMKLGDDIPGSFDLSSLRLLGSVGEPINPHVWKWYYTVIGKNRCPVIDTWWQTETGGMMISALPGLETVPLKPGSGTRQIPGVDMTVVGEDGMDAKAGAKGHLVIQRPWPGMLLTLWGDDEKYKEAYWSRYPGRYHTGDYAMRDSDGYFWVLGRADDVLKVAGHRIGTAELESSIVAHGDVAESAVCGMPDDIKGQSIIAFVVLRGGVTRDHATLKSEIIAEIRGRIGPIATPKDVYFVSKLPKTRSGKIMRRLLKTMAGNRGAGDTSTLEDATAVSEIRSVLDRK